HPQNYLAVIKVIGVGGGVAETLHSLDILGGMPSGRIVKTFDEARRAARDVLEVATSEPAGSQASS
ncbi:MAG: hypothetical protein OXH76_08675, partial [Boseongicola sp.]|nr:hypothetical protein [Boseongicola sp.]